MFNKLRLVNFLSVQEESSESNELAISPQGNSNCSPSTSPYPVTRNKGRKIITRKLRRRRVIEFSARVEESIDGDMEDEIHMHTAEEAGLIMPPKSPC